jgi:CheY-like chemotaxis protein
MDKALPGGIFEPLFSTAKTGFGTGMGLSVVHSIIVQSGGYLVAECEIGRGTTFQVLLPCVASSRQTSEVAAEKRSCGEGPAPTILLVEDDDSVRRMMRHLLEREGYRMLEAENAQRAVEVAGSYEGAIHVLVTDVLMPGMTGLDLAAKLLHLRPDLKILFVSGYPHDSLQRLGLSKGELNLLPKPFPVSELLRRVQMLVPRPALQ